MRIGIDARFYGPRVGGGGIGRYVAELVTRLQQEDTENDYVLFLKKENFHECVITNPRFRKHLVDIHWYTVDEQRFLPQEVRRANVDFMHYPHWNVPFFSRTPFLVTIHDLILLDDPISARSSSRHPIIHGFKYAAYRTVLEHAIHRSRHIITVSDYSKSRVLAHFGIKPSKVSVIHNGITDPVETRNVSLTALGVYEPFVLYVGNAYPHKNLSLILPAFAHVRTMHPDVQLVIAGRRERFSLLLEKEARRLDIPRHAIRFLDLPTDAEISALYTNASLFLFPSRIEGFGMPPLEAMRHGAPAAVAQTSSMPELLGDHALWFDPDDADTLAGYMLEAIQNPEQFKAGREERVNHAQSFSWDTTTQRTLDIYKRFPTL